MPKLHELLAVESNLESQAVKVRTELSDTFAKKRHLFEEKRVLFTSNSENSQPVLETQSSIQSTVGKELTWVGKHLGKFIDASYQVAEANTKARADVVLEDGTTILKQIPATALLELEKRFTEIRDLICTVPTLDPAKSFALDSQREPGIFKAREITKSRTRKDMRVIVKYEATKEHPAQTELVPEDKTIGTITEQEWSGMMTPAEKSAMLDRAEQIIRAIRSARSRANDTECDTNQKIADTLLGYIINRK